MRNLDACAVASDEDLVLDSPAQFKALGHPLRHRLINVLRQRPATLSQLALALGSTKGTLSYHMTVLLSAGLVRSAGTRTVRGGTEQYFELVSTGFRPVMPGAGAAKFLINAALAEMVPGGPEQTLLTHLRLSAPQAEALAQRLSEFANETRGDDDGESYGLLLSLYRADIPKLPEDT
jgi:DNA-binding transcriptional ArsR family regulator